MSKKIIFITGASSGIGEITARKLIADGHRVVLTARRLDRLQTLAAELGDRAEAIELDVTNRNAVADTVNQTVARHGRLDVIVNNAGLMPLSFISAGKTDEWERMVDVNIKGVLWGIAAAQPHFLQQGHGHFINIASIAGINVFPTGAVYCGTKHAVRAISEGLRQESRGKYRVTTISPGVFDTELTGTITDERAAGGADKLYEVAQKPDAIGNAIAWAISQPPEVDVNEMLIRPTQQA